MFNKVIINFPLPDDLTSTSAIVYQLYPAPSRRFLHHFRWTVITRTPAPVFSVLGFNFLEEWFWYIDCLYTPLYVIQTLDIHTCIGEFSPMAGGQPRVSSNHGSAISTVTGQSFPSALRASGVTNSHVVFGYKSNTVCHKQITQMSLALNVDREMELDIEKIEAWFQTYRGDLRSGQGSSLRGQQPTSSIIISK